MKIIIIGASGMLGQELVKVFENGEQNNELLKWGRAELDISNEEQVLERIVNESPDLVINSAAYNDVDGCETNFEIAKAVNGDGPVNIARACQKVGAIFIHYGTDYVFAGDKKEGYTENDQAVPISKYGQSKLMGEKALQENDKTYVIRTSRLYGHPALSEGAKKSFVDVMLKLAEDRDKLDIVDEEYSNPTYVLDLAQQTKVLLDGDYKYGLYHGVNEGACTWADFARETFRIAGKNVIINKVGSDKFPRPAKRPAYSSLINTKLPKSRKWEEALKDYLEK